MTAGRRELRVLVTGGGTIAPIDDVRVIANLSTGGLAARTVVSFLEQGARVWHLRTPTAERPFERLARFDLDCGDATAEIERLEVLRREWLRLCDRLTSVDLKRGTVEDYAESLRGLIERETPDVIVLAAAVSDFEPIAISGKIDSRAAFETLELRRTPKVISSVRDWAPGAYLVGFKLLSGVSERELIDAAARAGRETRADLTVANDFRAKAAGRHSLHLVAPDGRYETLEPGDDLADRLARALLSRVNARVEVRLS